MTKFGKLLGAAAVVATVALASTAADATVYVGGSFAFAAFTSTTGTPSSSLTSFPLTPSLGSYLTGGSPAGNMTTDPALSTNSFVFSSSPITLDFTTASSFAFAFAGSIGTFSPNLITFLGTSSISGHIVASWAVDGLFTPGSDFSNTADSFTARETWSITQSGGATDADSISGTFQAPASVNVPEPVTLSLFGVGLVGAAAFRRRRKSQNAA